MSAQTITCKLRSQVGQCEAAVFRKRFARSQCDAARESAVFLHKASATGSAHIFAPAAIVSHPGTPFSPLMLCSGDRAQQRIGMIRMCMVCADECRRKVRRPVIYCAIYATSKLYILRKRDGQSDCPCSCLISV